MLRRFLALWLVLLLCLGSLTSASAHQLDTARTLASALAWLRDQQRADGGFAGFSGESDPGISSDAALAFAAAGIDLQSVRAPGEQASLLDYLASVTSSYSERVGGAAKLALVAIASGRDPRNFAGIDLIVRIRQHYDATTGLYDTQLFSNAYALLALAAYDRNLVPEKAIRAVIDRQGADGSWAWDGSTAPGAGDSNTTALAVQALVALGYGDHPAITHALDYFRSVQAADGSFAYQPSEPLAGDANSTALVIQALLATGQEPQSDTWRWALDALAHFANPSGALRWRDDAPDDNLFATAQAIPALALQAFPIRPVAPLVVAHRAVTAQETGCRLFVETGHGLCGDFLSAWERFGGLANLGYPLTRPYYDPVLGLVVQYTERARLELHQGPNGETVVLLGRLGAERAHQVPAEALAPAPPPTSPACRYFEETHHTLCHGFRAYWEQFGGLTVFGYPISEEFVENGVVVQYFERARFEWHPGAWPQRHDVLLGRLGAETVDWVLKGAQ